MTRSPRTVYNAVHADKVRGAEQRTGGIQAIAAQRRRLGRASPGHGVATSGVPAVYVDHARICIEAHVHAAASITAAAVAATSAAGRGKYAHAETARRPARRGSVHGKRCRHLDLQATWHSSQRPRSRPRHPQRCQLGCPRLTQPQRATIGGGIDP